MKRIYLPLGRRLFLLCAFLFALVALFPLRIALDMLALDRMGFAARSVEGGVWLGRIRQLQFRETPLGTLGARLELLPLLLGQARVDLVRAQGAPDNFKGSLLISRSGFGVDDVTASLGLAGSLAPLPVSGLDLTDVTARFRNGACDAASGRVRARISGDVAGINLSQGLSGAVTCEGNALLLPLISQSGMEQINLRLLPSGDYRAEMLVKSSDGTMAGKLLALGFTPGGGGYRLTLNGSF